ncbi:MAG: hypothetical protein ACRBM6_23155 [Geminicoccales bacterium]
MAQETVSDAESTWLEADQSRCDAAWERMQERALKAFRDGDLAAAVQSWATAFDIAKQNFAWGDPRLAASFTNHAFALIRQDQLHPATLLLNDAVRCWEDSWRWVPLMRPLPGDGQAAEDRYDDAVLPELYAFIKRGQAITETLAKERQLPNGGLEEWQENKPSTMCDLRKLVSAILLMASKAP